MIIIADNGEKSSYDHEVLFVNVGDLPIGPVVEFLIQHIREHREDDDGPDPFIHAIVERFEWACVDSLVPVAKLWERIDKHACAVRQCRDKKILALGGWDGRQLSYDAFKKGEAEIRARPWTPEECPCTCSSGELFKLARESA